MTYPTKLSPSDRAAIKEMYASGATMREAASVLTEAGAASVSGLAMSHTEG